MSLHRSCFQALPLLLALVVAGPATAQPRGPGHGPHPQRQEVERRVRTLRAVALANRLDLSESEALRLNSVMKRYDERRDEVRARMHAALSRLRTLSELEAPEAAEVRAAVNAVLDAQEEMARLRREEIETLTQDLDPVRQARLLVFFREFPGEIRRLMREARRSGGPMGEVPGAVPGDAPPEDQRPR